MAWQQFDTIGGGPGMWGGGGFGSAFGGALVGALIGEGGFLGRRGHDGGASFGQWELFKEMSDTRREVALQPAFVENALLQQTIANNNQFMGLHAHVTAGNAAIERDILTNGFNTQLRDQANFGALMTEIAGVKCAIKDAQKDNLIASLANELAESRQAASEGRIIAAMLPPRPVPAYAAANPYENYMQTVRVAECNVGPRWDFNNCSR